nr:MAG: ORF1 [TTV-like mini virus]
MPWRRRWRWKRPYWQRRYRYRRPRPFIRRRYYRYRVRRPKRKLKTLPIRQWQPSVIHTSKIKGLMCLMLCSPHRLANNLCIYNQSIVPAHLPGGGGMSVYQFTLDSLYTMHNYVRNWWTKGNVNLPLVRYVKCIFKIYQSDELDIVFRYNRHPPFETTQLTYPSMQPSVLMMLNHTILIPSKKTKPIKKGYRKIIIKPPNLMTNRWFFSADIANKPLLTTQAVAASFDNYYINKNNVSNNTTIPVLNTNLFQNRQWGQNDWYSVRTDGTQQVWLWASYEPVTLAQPHPKGKDVILLANGKNYTAGWDFEDFKRYSATEQKTYANWKTQIHIHTGNPFHKNYMHPDQHHDVYFFISRGNDPTQHLKNSETDLLTDLTLMHEPLYYMTRYNPNADKGDDTKTYLLQNFKHEHGWDPPNDHKLILESFPLYINWWGFIDFQKQQHVLTNIDTSAIFCCKTKALHGADRLPVFVPLSIDFTLGNSPFEQGVNDLDKDRWYPQVQYQEQAINNLLSTGPGTAKMYNIQNAEAKLKYEFVFKFGGNPAPMVELKDPTEQPKFPIFNNILQTNSLQDPTTPPEYFLWNFDQRRDFLTRSATERILKDWSTKRISFTDATTTPGPPPVLLQTQPTSTDEETDSEKDETTLISQVLKQRYKQQLLKHRIRQLMDQQQKLE